ISVGQQLDVSGQCSVDSAGNLSLDAATCMVGGTPTPCQARLASSRIWGTLSSATPGSAVLYVLTIGNFAPAGFNFAGTGAPVANPAAYAVNTGTLDESGVAASTLLAVDGLVSPFGAAPPDFNATAIALGSAFAGALSSTLNGTNKIYRLVAVGQLNAAANTFVASRISVALYE